ncbi:hypothetical protein CPB83DRAFT_903106 [Crepidotus variabilis]|uniref:Uncharacterized protein n=1 Tax=Crepidotus variabilis TaxID=179855 RepID=A0A9P6ER27_9AGAR|nr:hypothetical protein CPB83DRAFT_903106 [Crepidotus variabilis]
MNLCLGNPPRPPRNIAPAFVWRQSHSEEIAAQVNQRALAEGRSRKSFAPLREKVVKEMYAALPQEEKEKWSAKAKEQHEEDLTKWNKELKRPPSEELNDRQSSIKVLPDFLQFLVEAVGERTGWQASIIAGGPEPASGGRLNICAFWLNQHGKNSPLLEDQPKRPEGWEDSAEIFGEFLRKCYSPDECRSQAFPVNQQFTHLGNLNTSDANETQAIQVATLSSAAMAERSGSPISSTRSGSLTPRPSTPQVATNQDSEMTSDLLDRTKISTAGSSSSAGSSSMNSTADAEGYRVIQMRVTNEYLNQGANVEAPLFQSEVSRGKRRADEAQLGDNSNPSKRHIQSAM